MGGVPLTRPPPMHEMNPTFVGARRGRPGQSQPLGALKPLGGVLMNRLCLGLVALLGAALVAGCSDDDDDDDSGNGGLPTLDGPQEGTIIITLATNTVTVTQQPQGVKLSGT